MINVNLVMFCIVSETVYFEAENSYFLDLFWSPPSLEVSSVEFLNEGLSRSR